MHVPTVNIRPSLDVSSLGVMNFLNEAVSRYPEAISFAPGRPIESYFHVEDSLKWISTFVEYQAESIGITRDEAFNGLGQYGRTTGLIQDILAEHLRIDENIDVDPDSILVTNGCQEAIAILALGLMDPVTDVLLVSDPGYIGMSGLAQAVGIEVKAVALGDNGLDMDTLASAVDEVRRGGKRPRALYDVPSFNNPLGTSLSTQRRKELLHFAELEDILLLEDATYNAFAFDEFPCPSLKSLDDKGRVIYLGSFAKTLFPGARMGFAIADQRSSTGKPLISELSKIKSLLTVNTPPIMQALVGGALLSNSGSIKPFVAEKLARYHSNRGYLLQALEKQLGGVPGVTWNRPRGGFFVTMTLPFRFDEDTVAQCAREYGVICCPMSFFSLLPGREKQVRLSFSYVNQEQIEEGVARLARFIERRVDH